MRVFQGIWRGKLVSIKPRFDETIVRIQRDLPVAARLLDEGVDDRAAPTGVLVAD